MRYFASKDVWLGLRTRIEPLYRKGFLLRNQSTNISTLDGFRFAAQITRHQCNRLKLFADNIILPYIKLMSTCCRFDELGRRRTPGVDHRTTLSDIIDDLHL